MRSSRYQVISLSGHLVIRASRYLGISLLGHLSIRASRYEVISLSGHLAVWGLLMRSFTITMKASG